MNPEPGKARREFLDECDFVVKTPAAWFIKGNDSSYSTQVVSIPINLFIGIKKKTKNTTLEIEINGGSQHLEDLTASNMKLVQTEDDLVD